MTVHSASPSDEGVFDQHRVIEGMHRTQGLREIIQTNENFKNFTFECILLMRLTAIQEALIAGWANKQSDNRVTGNFLSLLEKTMKMVENYEAENGKKPNSSQFCETYPVFADDLQALTSAATTRKKGKGKVKGSVSKTSERSLSSKGRILLYTVTRIPKSILDKIVQTLQSEVDEHWENWRMAATTRNPASAGISNDIVPSNIDDVLSWDQTSTYNLSNTAYGQHSGWEPQGFWYEMAYHRFCGMIQQNLPRNDANTKEESLKPVQGWRKELTKLHKLHPYAEWPDDFKNKICQDLLYTRNRDIDDEVIANEKNPGLSNAFRGFCSRHFPAFARSQQEVTMTSSRSKRSQSKAAAPGTVFTESDHGSDVHDLQLELALPVLESNEEPAPESQKEDQSQEEPYSKRPRRAKAAASAQIIQQIADEEAQEEGVLRKIERRHVDNLRNARVILRNTSALESANAYVIEMQRWQRETQDVSSMKVGLIIADPPWGVMRKTLAERMRDIPLTESEIKELCLKFRQMLSPSGNVIIFASYWDLDLWRTKLVEAGFTVAKVPNLIVYAQSQSYRRGRGSDYHQSNTIVFILAWLEKPVRHLKGNGFNMVKSTFPATSQTIDNYHPPRKPMKLPGSNDRVRTEEKSIELYMELILRYTNKGDIVYDPFAGTAASAIAAIRWTRQFVGAEQDPVVFQASLRRINEQIYMMMATNHLPRPETVDQGAVDYLHQYIQVKETEWEKLCSLLENAPDGLLKNIPEGMKDLPPVEYLEWQNINYQVYVAESQIPMAGKGLFAGRNFAKNEMIAPYFGTLSTYHSAVRRHGSEKQLTLRERLVECKYLCQSSDNICPFIIDGDINCAAAFANDIKGSPFKVNAMLVEALGDDDYRDTWLHNVINYPEKALRDPRLITIAAHTDIKAGEEILISYGKPYWDAEVMFKDDETGTVSESDLETSADEMRPIE